MMSVLPLPDSVESTDRLLMRHFQKTIAFEQLVQLVWCLPEKASSVAHQLWELRDSGRCPPRGENFDFIESLERASHACPPGFELFGCYGLMRAEVDKSYNLDGWRAASRFAQAALGADDKPLEAAASFLGWWIEASGQKHESLLFCSVVLFLLLMQRCEQSPVKGYNDFARWILQMEQNLYHPNHRFPDYPTEWLFRAVRSRTFDETTMRQWRVWGRVSPLLDLSEAPDVRRLLVLLATGFDEQMLGDV